MKFTYIDYGDDFINNLKDDEKTIFVFSGNSLKNLAEDRLKRGIFDKKSLFFTMNSFKENALLSDDLVLKEEKRTLLFYRAIPKELKKKMRINSYYDMIDLGENFLKFYGELDEYEVTDLSGLQTWQVEYLENLTIIKKNYEELLKKYRYVPNDWARTLKNYSPDIFDSYEKVIFVDIPYFTPLEKRLLSKLREKFQVELILQMAKEDFSKEDMRIKRFTFPKTTGNIQVTQVNEEMHQLINLLEQLKGFSGDIFSPDPDSNSYHNLVPKIIDPSRGISLKETNLYRFMDIQYNLLSSLTIIKGTLYFSTNTLLKALENRVFREYYSVEERDMTAFLKLLEEEYQYLTEKFVESNDFIGIFYPQFVQPGEDPHIINLQKKLLQIMKDVINIKSCSNVEELIDHFGNPENFRFNDLDQDRYSDVIEKFFESLSEVKSIEMLEMHQDWKEYFGNTLAEPLYKLILKYMQGKKIKAIPKKESSSLTIKPVEDKAPTLRDVGIFIDISGDSLPETAGGEFLLTEKQREENGLISREEKRLLQKYRFFQNIFNCVDTCIFSMKNEENNLDSSPFIEELVMNYSLDIKEPVYSQGDILSIARNLFKGSSAKNIRLGDSLPKSASDFSSEGIRLGSYDFTLLSLCPYKYYLKKIAFLDSGTRSIDGKLSPRVIGNIIHETMERIASLKKEEIKSRDFSLENIPVEKILMSYVKDKRLHLPFQLENYYYEVMFPIFAQNIRIFYGELEKAVTSQEITGFSEEKSKKMPLIDGPVKVTLSGRADLTMEGKSDKYIVDYKTGNGDAKQLDFYSILYYGEGDTAQKYIFNAWKGELQNFSNNKRKILSSNEMKENIEAFISSPFYKRTKRHSSCRECEYAEICRTRWENEN